MQSRAWVTCITDWMDVSCPHAFPRNPRRHWVSGPTISIGRNAIARLCTPNRPISSDLAGYVKQGRVSGGGQEVYRVDNRDRDDVFFGPEVKVEYPLQYLISQ